MLSIDIEAWPLASQLFGGDKRYKYILKMEASDNSTLEDLINSLCTNYPELDKVFARTDSNELYSSLMCVLVLLNERPMNSTNDYKTKLQDGDRVLFVQGFAGG